MSSPAFPQLATGNVAQYPLQKIRVLRTVQNVLPDGSVLSLTDPGARTLIWQLDYSNLTAQDLNLLRDHWLLCKGPLRSFVFLDPMENLLACSANLGANAWQKPSSLLITQPIVDPEGTYGALTLTNIGTSTQEISQTLEIPSSYSYCFSVYVRSENRTSIALIRRGPSDEQAYTRMVGTEWQRIQSAGALADSGEELTIALSLSAGQSIDLYGPQLECQFQPSRYRPTAASGGVYANAHYVGTTFNGRALGPTSYFASLVIEAPLQDQQ